jgi:hypothetical protein
MPETFVQVYEFIPSGKELVEQKQYITPTAGKERVAITKESIPLGMKRIKDKDAKNYKRYIDNILENHLDNFNELRWMEDTDDFLEKLLKLMTHVKLKSSDEVFITPSHFTIPN